MTKIPDRAEIYRTQDGLWYWRLRAANNEIIAQGEGYERVGDVEHMLTNHFPGVKIVNLEER